MPFMDGVPTVTIQLDKPREFGFTMGAIRRVRAQLGGEPDLTKEDGTVDPAKLLPVLPVYMWACMDDGGRREITVEQLEDMLHPGNLVATLEALTRMFVASNPEAAAGATPDPTQARPQLQATG